MNAARKTSAAREKDLKLAIHRIEQGRAHTKATSLCISSVAREAGVSSALIHNHYPSIAESIRVKVGASSRQARDAKQRELVDEKSKAKALREELKRAEHRIAQLASINETMLVRLRLLEVASAAGNVRALPQNRVKKS